MSVNFAQLLTLFPELFGLYRPSSAWTNKQNHILHSNIDTQSIMFLTVV